MTGLRFRDEFQRQLAYAGAAAFMVGFWYSVGKVAALAWSLL